MRNLALVFPLVFLAACDALIEAPDPSDFNGAGGGAGGSGGGVVLPPGPPPKCEPTGSPVAKLLRVSNFEYQSIAADVLGIPLDPALFSRWTPVAQVYGFDTMSETRIDAQAMEVQLATAESLAGLVMASKTMTQHCPAIAPAQTPSCTLKARYSALDDFSDTQARDCWSYLDSSGVPMIFDNTKSWWRKEPDQTVLVMANAAHPGSSLDSVRRWVSPVSASITVTGSFGAVGGGGDGVLVTIRRNGTAIFTQDLAAGASAPFTLPLTVAQNDQLDFVVNRKTTASFDTTAFSASIAFSPTPRKQAWTWANCVQPLVAQLASRAFRRPVRADELAEYQAVYETNRQGAAAAGFAEPVDMAMPAVLQAVFLSPNFVFKPELVPGGLDDKEKDFGLASRLALFVRGSVPDEELWQLAGTGGLSDPKVVRAQAERLLAKDLDRFAMHFGGQWLDFREAGNLGPLTASMQTETKEMFKAVLREELEPEKLIVPGFTIVDAPLATFYQLDFRDRQIPSYRLNTPDRGGLLAQSLFLARTGNGSEFRRPIHRGLWVLTRLLCRSLPHLDAATLEEIALSFGSINQSLPLPEKMAIHRKTSTRCGACHELMDPIGLALEKYDPKGNWRETYENNVPIVTNLEVDKMVVTDPRSLEAAIVATTDFRTCVATKLLTYGLNRGPASNEMCVAQRIGRPLDGRLPTFKGMTMDALTRALELTAVTP